jgi:transketolase
MPNVIIANTIKGKGISFMENQVVWHYRPPSDEQLAAALLELEAQS